MNVVRPAILLDAVHDGLPYLRTETGYFVEAAVTVQSVTLSAILPVLDAKNRPILEPTCFDINTSLQRALVKGIALHGIGLYLYQGSDEAPISVEASNDPVAPDVPQPEPPARPEPKRNVTSISGEARASQAQLRYLDSLVERTGTDRQRLCDFFHVDDLRDLTISAASRAIKSLEAKRDTNRRAA